QRDHEVLRSPAAQLDHVRIVRVALGAGVPGAVVALPVLAALAVGLVVAVVVGDQIGQGEPVVGGHEVDRGDRGAPGVLVQVGGAGQAGGELSDGAGLGAVEIAHRVPVAAVPLRPQGR